MKTPRCIALATTWNDVIHNCAALRVLDAGVIFDALKEATYAGQSLGFTLDRMLDARHGATWRADITIQRAASEVTRTFPAMLQAFARSRKFAHEAA